ncbi:hypothetical protein E2C01_050291 [Portunus trituberculatus]|uniref:Uncharacterized protein n=1 Tax=Portunus trituberculatus TaxID=210409 RepID=A0A5B7GII8_PORTR|nr:hypothetical protein [Portunus trituberculatus]
MSILPERPTAASLTSLAALAAISVAVIIFAISES